MSFILDALKKSESARQRDNWHDSAQVPSGSSKPATSRWLIFVGVLLLVNVLVLLVVLLKPDPINDETVLTTTSSQPASENIAPAHSAPATVTRRDPPPQPEPVQTQARENPPVAEKPATEKQGSMTTAKPPAPIIIPRTVVAEYRTLNEVRVNGGVQLPDLHLDIHVYSEIAADRFVFINMTKYKENATLNEGPLVTEIVPEGVLLDYRGTGFLLPRE